MPDPRNLSIHDYTYTLPEERIAKYPLAERDDSRLLIYEKGRISEDRYRNLAKWLPPESYLLFNNTKVIEARLLFKKPTGGVIELFCLEPDESYGDITSAMLQTGSVRWQCLVGGASKWKPGQVLEKNILIENRELVLRASYIEKRTDHFIIEFSWEPGHYHFAEVIHAAGAIPLPPYIRRPVEPEDAQRYQTIYAGQQGSVAAPTAGLHFTQAIFDELEIKNIARDYITLHVGAGTFKPVKSDIMQGHTMHAEYFEVSKSVVEHILDNLGNRIIAVGTTSLRTIESLYWLGVKLEKMSSGDWEVGSHPVELSQWEAYELESLKIPVKDSLRSLLEWMEKNKMERLLARTQILVAPGYVFKIVKGLVTNFHQPQSTLLLLVAAFIGDDWRKVYEYALQNDFRFLSYGDGCLLWRN